MTLASVTIEEEWTRETFRPLKVCTVVSGVALVPKSGETSRSPRQGNNNDDRDDDEADVVVEPAPRPASPAGASRVPGSDDDDD